MNPQEKKDGAIQLTRFRDSTLFRYGFGLSVLSASLEFLVVFVFASSLCPMPFLKFWVIPIIAYVFLGGLLLAGAGLIQTMLRRWRSG